MEIVIPSLRHCGLPLAFAGLLVAGLATAAETTAALNERALDAHRKRNIGDASALYGRVLEAEPPATPTAGQRALVLRFAPRLFHVAGEFFPLKDFAAILHPEKPIIAYHLFWEDDIGYPADNEPCDHEVVWVEYDPATRRVTRVTTYFHGKIISTGAAAEEANAHEGRPWIGVEWGYHGSLPWRSFGGAIPAVDTTLRQHWAFAHDKHFPLHPLGRGWPREYAGDYAAFLTFSVANDPVPLLREREMIHVSAWANATLNRRCLRYNFAAKTEWPWQGSP